MSLRGGLPGMNRSTFWWFSVIGMGMGIGTLLISSGNAIAVSAAPPKAETETTPPAAWLIQVQHVERRDPPQADLDAINEIRNKLKESTGSSMPADEREHLLSAQSGRPCAGCEGRGRGDGVLQHQGGERRQLVPALPKGDNRWRFKPMTPSPSSPA
ncbi:MAG: hypothetical protein KDA22_03170 [Phycisphaerales bacterium]|nr:hypothetical protein [Phycisphaerales bacterium]